MQPHPIITSADISCWFSQVVVSVCPRSQLWRTEYRPLPSKDKTNILRNDLNQLPWELNQLHFAENDLQAAGILNALKTGISLESVKRPLLHTPVMD